MWPINALHGPSHLSDFNIFNYRKRGEGGGQKVMIGIIISENVDNLDGPLVRAHNILYSSFKESIKMGSPSYICNHVM